LQRKASAAEVAVENFVANSHSENEVYLTPVKMQDFRLATGSPVFVDFKSIPYQNVEVLEWYRRERLADHFYKQPECSQLTALAREGITQLVLGSNLFSFHCQGMIRVYQDRYYRVYRLSPNP
jgi:hypothetical protein